MTRFRLRFSAALLGMTTLAGTAHAEFYPYYSGNRPTLPSNVVPARYYSDPYATAHAPASTYPAPAPAAQPLIQPAPQQVYVQPAPPQPVYAAPAPAPAPAVIAYNPPAPVATIAPAPAYQAPAYNPPPAPAYTPPPAYAPAPVAAGAPSYPTSYNDTQPTYGYNAAPVATTYTPYTEPKQRRKDSYTLGVEAYYDRYQEKVFNLDNRGQFGSITGSYTHYFDPIWFGTLDGRASYGQDDYSSVSGKISNVNEYEFETRGVGGWDVDYGQGRHFKTYIGLGMRYFVDSLKDQVTDLGAVGYDRRILQFYAPVGFTYEFPAYGLTFAPNIEFDPLLYGRVNSRFQNFGLEEFKNNQHDGYGWRGEVMMGRVDSRGYGWQAGPFIRYWMIEDSDTDQTSSGSGLEPKNSRFQAGATFRMLF